MTHPCEPDPVRFSKPYTIYDEEQVVENGRILKKTVVRTVRPMEMFVGLKASDFALENVIAAGAVDMLKPTVLHNGDIDFVDKIDGTLNEIMDQIDANAAVAEAPKNNVNE